MNLSNFKLKYLLLNILITSPFYMFLYIILSHAFEAQLTAIAILIFSLYLKNVMYESKMDYLQHKITQIENK